MSVEIYVHKVSQHKLFHYIILNNNRIGKQFENVLWTLKSLISKLTFGVYIGFFVSWFALKVIETLFLADGNQNGHSCETT